MLILHDIVIPLDITEEFVSTVFKPLYDLNTPNSCVFMWALLDPVPAIIRRAIAPHSAGLPDSLIV